MHERDMFKFTICNIAGKQNFYQYKMFIKDS